MQAKEGTVRPIVPWKVVRDQRQQILIRLNPQRGGNF